MKGVADLYKDLEEVGCAKVKKFQVSQSEANAFNLGDLFNRIDSLMNVDAGTFVKLYVDDELMMSDTRMECLSNRDFIINAHGDVMIAGLGIGLVLYNLESKVKSGQITSITVYEKHQDVIDLIGHRFPNLPLKIICKDILTYKPPKGEKYDTIYFDIWPTIDYEKNLPEIKMLHNRWKFHKKNKESWMNSWMKEFMQQKRDEDRREENRYGWRW